jgi:ATP-dependent protease HslVU (ClpYQ) ATPase subunit
MTDAMTGEDKTKKVLYLGSGAFSISKPKRNPSKLRRSRLKKPQRGARK